MWIFTQYGFFSVVNTPAGSDIMTVRSRSRGQLEALVEAFKDDVDHLEDREIISYNDPQYGEYWDRDYEHRVILNAEQWVTLAACLASDITYSNFKSQVGKADVPDKYLSRLYRIYVEMEDETRQLSATLIN